MEVMKTDYARALAQLVPVFMPDLLFRLGKDGQPVFQGIRGLLCPPNSMPGKISAAAKCGR